MAKGTLLMLMSACGRARTLAANLFVLLMLAYPTSACMDWDSLRVRIRADAGDDSGTQLPGQMRALASWYFSNDRARERDGLVQFADQAPLPPEVALTMDSGEPAMFQAGHLVLNQRTLGSDPNSGLALARAIYSAPRGFAVELWVQDLTTGTGAPLFEFTGWGLRLIRHPAGLSVELHGSQQQLVDLPVSGQFEGLHHVIVSLRRPNGLLVAYLDGQLASSANEDSVGVLDETTPTRFIIGNYDLAFTVLGATFFDEPLDESTVRARFQAGAVPR